MWGHVDVRSSRAAGGRACRDRLFACRVVRRTAGVMRRRSQCKIVRSARHLTLLLVPLTSVSSVACGYDEEARATFVRQADSICVAIRREGFQGRPVAEKDDLDPELAEIGRQTETLAQRHDMIVIRLRKLEAPPGIDGAYEEYLTNLEAQAAHGHEIARDILSGKEPDPAARLQLTQSIRRNVPLVDAIGFKRCNAQAVGDVRPEFR